jgi:hypothetical protein
MITNAAELKESIQKLESDRIIQGFLIKQEFDDAYQSINPMNLLKGETASSQFKGSNMISTSVGLATGYLIKKWIIGKSDNPIRTMIGSAVQIGTINLMARYQGAIEVVGRTLLQLFLHKDKKQDDTV